MASISDEYFQTLFCGTFRSCQETVFARLKDYKIMDDRFRSGMDMHQDCFFAVLVLVQMDIRQNPLFTSDYDLVYPFLQPVPDDFVQPVPAATMSDTSKEEDSDSSSDASVSTTASSRDPGPSILQMFDELNVSSYEEESQEETSSVDTK
jgi:hypothetical protein